MHLNLDLSFLTIPIVWKLDRYGHPVLCILNKSSEIIYLLIYVFIDFFRSSVGTHFHHKRAAISKKQPENLDLEINRAKI